MTLKQMYDLCLDRHIEVLHRVFANIKAVCMKVGECELISLNSAGMSENEERVALASEIAHLKHGLIYNITDANTPQGRLNIAQSECRAKKETIKMLLPFSELQAAVVENNFTEHWQIAEYFGLPEAFVADAGAYYETQGLILSYCQKAEE